MQRWGMCFLDLASRAREIKIFEYGLFGPFEPVALPWWCMSVLFLIFALLDEWCVFEGMKWRVLGHFLEMSYSMNVFFQLCLCEVGRRQVKMTCLVRKFWLSHNRGMSFYLLHFVLELENTPDGDTEMDMIKSDHHSTADEEVYLSNPPFREKKRGAVEFFWDVCNGDLLPDPSLCWLSFLRTSDRCTGSSPKRCW